MDLLLTYRFWSRQIESCLHGTKSKMEKNLQVTNRGFDSAWTLRDPRYTPRAAPLVP